MLTKLGLYVIENSFRAFSISSKSCRKVALLGAAGSVGQPLSLLLKSNPLITRLALYDNAKSIIPIAKDLSLVNTPAIVNFGYGRNQLATTLNKAEVVIICAGIPRKSGESRSDLFEINAEIIYDLAQECTKYCPNAMLVLITNPINALIPLISQIYKQRNCYNPSHIFGITTLDSVRTLTFAANYLKKPAKSIKVPVIGGHSSNTIIPVFSQAKPTEIKFQSIEDWRDIVTQIKTAGTHVIEAKGTVTLSMAYAAAKFCNSLICAMNGKKNIVECAFVRASNDIGLEYLATPLLLGENGIAENYGVGVLNNYEKLLLEQAVPFLLCDIKKGLDFCADKNFSKRTKEKVSCYELFGVSTS